MAGFGASTSSAFGQTGGLTTPGSTPPPGVPGKATLLADGRAIPPTDAPAQVRKAIRAGNRIRRKPYLYGGGHARFRDRGYDCSGAVSFVLHAAGLLPRPLPSGSFMRWGVPGYGRWITVYANRGHMYAVIAGLRWDTSAVGERLRSGSGPRWRRTARSPAGYSIRHFAGF